MKTIAIFAVLAFAMAQEPLPHASQEMRVTNNTHLARYTKSGGLAY